MRAIDGDALEKEGWSLHRTIRVDKNTEEYQTKPLRRVPTIEPEPHWIPCSERLPEEDDYKSCIECPDGAVWYFTENGTMGIGYYYKSTKEWSTTDDLKTDGKVVAWKPLPEPYREEEHGQ